MQIAWFKSTPGDMGDGRFNSIILEHFFNWLRGRESNLISPTFFWPMPGALTFSDNHFGSAWIYSLFRLCGADRYIAFDLWYLSAFVLNFFCTHWVLRKFGFSVIAAAIGAFIFAFAMPVSAQQGHAQLIYRFPVPLSMLAWQRFYESGRLSSLGLCALLVAAQFYMSIYLGFFLVLLLVGWLLAQYLVERRDMLQRVKSIVVQSADWPIPAALLLAALLALAWLLYPYVHYSRLYGFHRDIGEIASMLPRVRSYLLADDSRLWQAASRAAAGAMPMRHEQQMFIGIGAIALCVVGLWKCKANVVRVAFATLLLLVVFTLSVKDKSLYLLVAGLPGFDSIRAVSRVIVVMLFPVAVMAAAGVDVLLVRGKSGIASFTVLLAVCVTEAATANAYSTLIDIQKYHLAEVRALLPARLPPGTMVYVPPEAPPTYYVAELDGMLIAQEEGVRTLNGYSGNIPAGYMPVPEAPCAQASSRMQAAKAFYAKVLKQPLPNGFNGPLLVADHRECKLAPRD